VPDPRAPDVPARSAARALSAAAPDFPAGLLDLPDPPAELFVRGGALPRVCEAVAIVGSRAASPYGTEQAGRLAGDLARLGFVVVSGLARGIDAAAHRGALAAGGRTVAVLPAGLDAITPAYHAALAEAIARRGALVTEWAAGPPRGRGVFVERNRLIAALAAATVVVEAAPRSGALTTAACAARLGRPLLAVPGDVDRETARGCHALIRGGARLCERAADVLAALGGAGIAGRSPAGGEPPARATPPGGGRDAAPGAEGGEGVEGRLLAALDGVPRTVDTLAARAGLEVPRALAALVALEWAGAAAARPGQRWIRGGS
jgi:DNA processing protein